MVEERTVTHFLHSPSSSATPPAAGVFSAYPSSNESTEQFRAENSKGQYSDAVLSGLESQNEEQISGVIEKVKVLKDVWK